MSIVRRDKEIYLFFKEPNGTFKDEKLSIWNEKLTVGTENRLDTAEKKLVNV